MSADPLNQRQYDIDWLRAFAIVVVFLFHCAVFFSYEYWHVKNDRLSFGMTVFVGIVSQWIMPLFFLLSATSSHHALEHRTNGAYVRERFTRLVVPLLFGMFVLSPPQVYIERLTHSEFQGSFFAFIPRYFDGFYRLGGNFAWMGLHLWYLEILFLFSIITLPLFRLLQRGAVQTFLRDKVTGFFTKPGMIFLLALPIGLAEALVNIKQTILSKRDFGGWSPLIYLVVFILGYLIAGDRRLGQQIERQRVISLLMGVMTSVAGYLILTAGGSSSTISFSLLRGFNSWFWVLAILGVGSRYLSFSTPSLKYVNEAVLPFYILHQPIIVITGYFIAGWNAGVPVKFAVLTIFSFLVIVLVYDRAVRRVQVLRFLFGMKHSP
jgi:peptidoglycan/LPS O-acetylase OafA/YrhL